MTNFIGEKPDILKCCPMTASSRKGESENEFRERWRRVNSLSQDKKDLLSSEFAIIEIYNIAIALNFNSETASDIAKIVRAVILDDIRIEQLDFFLSEKFSFLELDKRLKIKDVIVKIISYNPENENNANGYLKISLVDALKAYPKLGEQLITSAPMKLRVFPEMVKPSIKNWISDYHDHLGSGKHGTIERGNFLFHSDNAKRITSVERRKLAEVLKSLDDGSELSVDKENQKIVFEIVSEPQPRTIQTQPISQPVSPLQARPFARPVEISEPPIREEKEKKIESFFGQNQTQRPRENFSQTPKAIESFPQREEAESPKNISEAGVEKEKKEVPEPNRSFGDFHVSKPSALSFAEEKYEIPKKESDTLNRSMGTVWNPAEAVKKRMEAESSGFFAPKKNEEKKNFSDDGEERGGKIRFSSAQVLPVEKKQEVRKAQPAEKESFQPQYQKPMASSNVVNLNKNDELMEKLKMMNKEAAEKHKANAVFRITPTGFVRDSGNSKQNSDSSPKVQGNVVDLKS